MSLSAERLAVIVLLGCIASAWLPAGAQPTTRREAFYRCTDSRGQTHYGDSMPGACVGFDTQVLDGRGMQIRLIEGDQTRANRLQRESAEEAARRARNEQAQRDRVLLDTYLTVDDIERLRDQRLDLLDAQLKLTQQNLNVLRDRQQRVQQQLARFRPYSDQPDAPPVPDNLAAEMVNIVRGLDTYNQTILQKQTEQQELTNAFARDIARFRQLKGIK